MQKISTLVITYNEERNIERCLESVLPISEEIIVVDSHSTDATVEIARRYTSRVYSRDWPGYGKQKQWALDQASHPWVLSIDADEELSPELRDEIRQLSFDRDGYWVPRKVWYLNRWIEHGGWYPNYVLRLFEREKAKFTENILHESAEVLGETARLRNPLHHYSYRDVSHHLEKMNTFTSLAAKQMYARGRRAGLFSILCFPPLEFFKAYFLKRGFLDGRAGLVIASLHATYVFQKHAKLFELTLPASVARKDRPAPEEPSSSDRGAEIHCETRP